MTRKPFIIKSISIIPEFATGIAFATRNPRTKRCWQIPGITPASAQKSLRDFFGRPLRGKFCNIPIAKFGIILIMLVFLSQSAPLYALEFGKNLCQPKLRPIALNEAKDSNANGAGDVVEAIGNELVPAPPELRIDDLLERQDFLRRIATLLRLTERSGREWGFGVSRSGRLRSISSGGYSLIATKDGKGVFVHTHPLWRIDWFNSRFFLPSGADLRGRQSKEGIVAFGTRKFGYFLTIFDKEIVVPAGIGVDFSARKPQQLWEEIRRLSEMGGIRFYGLQNFNDGRKIRYRIRPIKPLRMKRIVSHLIKEGFAVEQAIKDTMYEYFASLPMQELEEYQTYLLNRQSRYAAAVDSGIGGEEHTNLMRCYLYMAGEEIKTLKRAIFNIQIKDALLGELAFQQFLRAGDASFGPGQGAGEKSRADEAVANAVGDVRDKAIEEAARWSTGKPDDVKLNNGKSLERLVEVQLPDGRKMLVMDYHYYAFPFWWKVYKEGIIPKGCALLHIDAHSDDRIIEYKDDPTSDEGATFQDALLFTIRRYDVESFIYPAVKNGLIDPGEWYHMRPDGMVYRLRFIAFADRKGFELVEKMDTETFLSRISISNKPLLCDIDIDGLDELYRGYSSEPPDKLEKIIEGHLSRIAGLSDYARVITIATSPGCVPAMGEAKATEYANKLAKMIYAKRLSGSVSDGDQAGDFWKGRVAVVMDASEASAQAIIRKLIAKGLADENIIPFVSSREDLGLRGIDLSTLEGVSRLKNLIQKEAGNREITLIINNMSPANPMLEDNLRSLGIVTMPDVLDDEAEWQRTTQEAIASCV